jgi:prepilin-type N-terminal cleavage/methylation domain-containing protein
MNKHNGFTLVEIIVSLLVIGIVMYAAVAIFINAGFKGVNVDLYTTAQSLAEEKLEKILSRNFASVSSEALSNFSGDFASYSSQVVVSYVSSEALDTAVGSGTNFRKVTVIISHPQLTNPFSLEAIKVNY